jgi:hypothetical protein
LQRERLKDTSEREKKVSEMYVCGGGGRGEGSEDIDSDFKDTYT